PMSDENALSRRQRGAIALAAGVLMAALTYRAYGLAPPMASDFDFVWIGLRAFVHGENPYRAVADAHVRGPLYYPLPALVALAPPRRRPGGFLMPAALLRWRRPEGRLLAALCCVPHVTTLYETLPLFLVPANRYQAYLLLALSYVAAVVQAWLVPGGSLLQQVV